MNAIVHATEAWMFFIMYQRSLPVLIRQVRLIILQPKQLCPDCFRALRYAAEFFKNKCNR
jgi:hypothetical protein